MIERLEGQERFTQGCNCEECKCRHGQCVNWGRNKLKNIDKALKKIDKLIKKGKLDGSKRSMFNSCKI